LIEERHGESAASGRTRRPLKALGVVIALIVVASLSLFLLRGVGFYLPSGSKTDGPLRIEYRTAEAFGHRQTIAALYGKQGLLADYLEAYRRNPTQDSQALFTTHDSEDSKGGTFFYDAGTGKVTRLADPSDIHAGESDELWSPGGRFAVLSPAEEIHLFNIEALTTVNLSKVLFADGRSRHLSFRSWSPDGQRLAVVVNRVPGQPYLSRQALLEVSAAQAVALYVASMSDRSRGLNWCWQKGEFLWRSTPSGYRLAAGPAPADGALVMTEPEFPSLLRGGASG